MSQNRKRSIIVLIILLAILIASVVVEDPNIPFLMCPFKALFKLPCPSCGMTHSFISIGHMRMREAFYFNILGPLLYSVLLIGIILSVAEVILNKLIIVNLFNRFQRQIMIILIPLVVVSWIVNLVKYLF